MSSTMEAVKVLIVDDEPETREHLSRLLGLERNDMGRHGRLRRRGDPDVDGHASRT